MNIRQSYYLLEDTTLTSYEKPFKDWNTTIAIDKRLKPLFPPLPTPLLDFNEKTSYGFGGINVNGILITQSLEMYHKEFLL